MRRLACTSIALVASCASQPPPPKAASTPAASTLATTGVRTRVGESPARLVAEPIALPGASGPLALDYLAADRAGQRIWVPAAGTGSVDIIDTKTRVVAKIDGFATGEREVRGKKRLLGPSSVTLGDGVVYVGNRGTGDVCSIDPVKLERTDCLHLDAPPDGIAYVATTKEVWVTVPSNGSLAILDASNSGKLTVKARMALDGEPEGYAVDSERGVFYTNLEDKDQTLAVDVRTRNVTASFESRCGSAGPRGLALDAANKRLFVACTDHVEVAALDRGGARIDQLATGAGVDNIDYVPELRRLYVAAGEKGTLLVAAVNDEGKLSLVGTGATAPGTRVVVADADGTAWVADPQAGRMLKLAVPAKR